MNQSTLQDFESSGVECPTCDRVFDSKKGMAAHHRQSHKESRKRMVPCDNCGNELKRIPSEVSDRNFCGSDCHYEFQSGENHHNYNSVKLPCEWCGDTCERNESHVSENGPFCDRSCYAEWLSKTRSGKNNPRWSRKQVECEWCDNDFYKKAHEIDNNFGHFCTLECYHKYQKANSQPNGLVDVVRDSLSDVTWRFIADRYRDEGNEKCEMCGSDPEERAHDVHHIIPIISGGSNHKCNLMTLCKNCHGKAERFTQQYPEFAPVLVE